MSIGNVIFALSIFIGGSITAVVIFTIEKLTAKAGVNKLQKGGGDEPRITQRFEGSSQLGPSSTARNWGFNDHEL